jgi:hypothetical protein
VNPIIRPGCHRVRGRLLVGLTIVIVLATGCGIGAEDTPRDIRPELIPPEQEVAAAESGSGQRVWMVAPPVQGRATMLQAVERDAAATPAELLESLLESVTLQERGSRISSAIPQDTTLVSARLATNDTLIVDLSGGFLGVSSELLTDAVAQVVYTACEFDGVSQVRLLIDGESREWLRGDGSATSDPLTIFDFPEYNPTSQPDFPAVPSPVEATTTTTT